MTISCPECGETLELPIELVGKPVKCPTCGSGFISDSGVTVPTRQSAPTPSQPPQPPPPPPPPTPEELYVAASWSDKYKKAKPENEAWVRAAWETEVVLDKIYDCGGLPTVSTSFLLNSSDIVHYELPETEMYETVSSTNQKRRYPRRQCLCYYFSHAPSPLPYHPLSLKTCPLWDSPADPVQIPAPYGPVCL